MTSLSDAHWLPVECKTELVEAIALGYRVESCDEVSPINKVLLALY